MIEAFERHLQAATFARQAEKATTLDEQIKFCQEFLHEHQKPVPINIAKGAEHYSISSNVDRFIIDDRDGKKILRVNYALSESEVLHYNKFQIHDLIRENLSRGLIDSVLTSGVIDIENTRDYATLRTIYTARLGVFKP